MCCGGDAPSPDPLIGQAAKANAETAKEALSWYKGIYADNIAPMQQENQALSRQLIEGYLGSQEQQQQFAADQNEFYKKTFRPLEEKVAQDAMEYDSDANVKRREGIAAANVNQQFSNAVGQTTRLMGRYGLSSGGAFKGITAKQALASAGAQTGAAFDTMDKGIALRAGAANFGRNMPNTAASYYGLSNQTGGQAFATSSGALGSGIAAGNFGGEGFKTSIYGNNSAGQLGIGMFDAQMKGYMADAQGTGAAVGGIATVAAAFI